MKANKTVSFIGFIRFLRVKENICIRQYVLFYNEESCVLRVENHDMVSVVWSVFVPGRTDSSTHILGIQETFAFEVMWNRMREIWYCAMCFLSYACTDEK